jgi:adenylate cyclase
MATIRQEEGHSHQMVFRIGISSGKAMIGNVGTSELFNYTAIGDVVNVAQRLEAAAQGGEILLERATYDAVAGSVLAEPLSPIQVKGRAQAVEVFRMTGLR